jgi:hypothetical protein
MMKAEKIKSCKRAKGRQIIRPQKKTTDQSSDGNMSIDNAKE